MKKYILFTFLVITVFANSQYYYQRFDGADTLQDGIQTDLDTINSVWEIGNPSKNYFQTALTVPNALVTDIKDPYPINDTSEVIFTLQNNQGHYGILAFVWSQKIDFEYRKDIGQIQFRCNNNPWEDAGDNPYVYNFYGFVDSNYMYPEIMGEEKGFTGTDTNWRSIWLCWDMSYLSWYDSVQVRFVLKSDSNQTNQDGWMIDNLEIQQTWVHTVEENSLEDYFNVFPNPTSDRIYIQLKKQPKFHIIEDMKLVNVEGKIVRSFQNVPTKFFIDIEDLPPGTYYLSIKSNLEESKSIPIIKK